MRDPGRGAGLELAAAARPRRRRGRSSKRRAREVDRRARPSRPAATSAATSAAASAITAASAASRAQGPAGAFPVPCSVIGFRLTGCPQGTVSVPAVRTKARFPAIARDAGHYESFYIKAARPDGGLGVWIRHTIHKRPQRRADGVDLVRALRRRGAGPGGDEGDVPGRRAVHARRRLRADRRRPGRARPGRRRDPHRGPQRRLGPHLRGPRRGRPPPPSLRVDVPRAAAADEAPQPPSPGPLQRPADRRRARDRARRLARDDRPQLGRRARRALDVDPGRGLRRRRQLLRHRRGADQGRPLDDALDRQRDAAHRRTRATASAASTAFAPPRSTTRRPSARSACPGRGSSCAGGCTPSRAASSPGSTPTPTGPSTTRSTARSRTST